MARSLLAALAAGAAAVVAARRVSDPIPVDVYEQLKATSNATMAQLQNNYLSYPTNGEPGKAGWATSDYSNWVSGFFPGQMLKLSNYTSANGAAPSAESAYWLQQGANWAWGLAPEQFDNTTHDVGFIVYTALGQYYHLTGNTTAHDVTLQTARTLMTRFNPIVGCIRSWGKGPAADHSFEVIADNLMNLELLWWAGQETGDASFWAVARSHADHMMRDLFQPFNPGCAWHLIVYNDTDGSIISRSSTPQGLGQNTVWSRGQSWSIYGFTMAHRFTADAAYLQQAVDAAECMIRLLSACCGSKTPYLWMPLWDYNVTAPDISIDTSAAMVGASALIELSWYLPAAQGARYAGFAKTLLDSAFTNWRYAPGETDATMRNGTVTFPLAGIPITYDDYYALEASMKWDATPESLRVAAEAHYLL